MRVYRCKNLAYFQRKFRQSTHISKEQIFSATEIELSMHLHSDVCNIKRKSLYTMKGIILERDLPIPSKWPKLPEP